MKNETEIIIEKMWQYKLNKKKQKIKWNAKINKKKLNNKMKKYALYGTPLV